MTDILFVEYRLDNNLIIINSLGRLPTYLSRIFKFPLFYLAFGVN